MLLLCAMSCHTCLLIHQHGMQFDDFTVMVRRFLGTRAQYVAWLMSVLVILGAGMAYHILLEETLFNIVGAVSQWTVGHSPASWTPAWAAAAILLMYPITNLRQLTVLVRINSVGAVFIFYVALFIVTRGVQALARHGTTIPAPPVPKDSTDSAITDDNGSNGSILAAAPAGELTVATAAASLKALAAAASSLVTLPSAWGGGTEEGDSGYGTADPPARGDRSTISAHHQPSSPLQRQQQRQYDQQQPQRLRHVTEQPSPPAAATQTAPHVAGSPPAEGHLHLYSNSGFAKLGGMGTLSYFIHNAIHPILRHCNPETRRVRTRPVV